MNNIKIIDKMVIERSIEGRFGCETQHQKQRNEKYKRKANYFHWKQLCGYYFSFCKWHAVNSGASTTTKIRQNEGKRMK